MPKEAITPSGAMKARSVTVESGSYSSKGAGVVGITASAPSDLTVNGGEFGS